jgi:general secretion pathway protein J
MKRVTISDLRGFTLLELLIAITVLSLIVVIVGSGIRLGFRAADAGEKKIESLERLRRSVAIIDAQIQSAIPLTFADQGERRTFFRGDKQGLRFVTNYSIWGGQTGDVVVNYRVGPDPQGRQTLYATENVVGTAAFVETRLLTDCEVIDFTYFDRGFTEGEGKWVDQWTEEVLVPDRIKLHFRYRNRDYSVISPTRVKGAGV